MLQATNIPLLDTTKELHFNGCFTIPYRYGGSDVQRQVLFLVTATTEDPQQALQQIYGVYHGFYHDF